MGFEQRYQDGSYLSRTGDWHEGDAAWKAAHVHAALAAAGLAPQRIADVGCGTGGVLAELQAMLPPATQFTGYELSSAAFPLAAARANARLRFVHGSPIGSGEVHDVMLAMDVFEHVPDYLGFLSGLRETADRFVFHVPLDLSVKGLLTGLPMYRRRSVGHLHYFTTETARATLEESGYRIVRAFHTHAVMQPPPRSWKAKLRTLPDRLLFRANPERCATWFGGCSWLVLAEPIRH